MSSSPHLYVERMKGSHEVYRIVDKKSRHSLILKSYASSPGHERNGKKEYERLLRVRRICGNCSYCNTIAPIAVEDGGSFLLEPFVSGQSLGHFMQRAFKHGEEGALYEKLTVVAGYLGTLHRNGSMTRPVDTSYALKTMTKHAIQAAAAGGLDENSLVQALRLAEEWRESFRSKRPLRCLTHGDATPSNFLFHGKKMYAIDLERSGYKDPVLDTGMLAGELFHYALAYAPDPYRADPFIGHLYWTYAGNFERQYDKFLETTRRNPFYMANSLLRICRNPGIGYEYKKALGFYALECLKSLPRYKE